MALCRVTVHSGGRRPQRATINYEAFANLIWSNARWLHTILSCDRKYPILERIGIRQCVGIWVIWVRKMWYYIIDFVFRLFDSPEKVQYEFQISNHLLCTICGSHLTVVYRFDDRSYCGYCRDDVDSDGAFSE